MPKAFARATTEFGEDFRQILLAATQWGADAQPLSSKPGAPFRDRSHHRRFMAACHRGFQKAQDRTVEVLQILSEDQSLTDEERTHREYALRRVIDGIAFTMLRTDVHVARRLILHDAPPPMQLDVVRRALVEANRLNAESRLTFALVSDLSTFIHVADVLRIDFREAPPKMELIELKDGQVNTLIQEKLKSYTPTDDALAKLRSDRSIDRRHIGQAERMLRQRIRLNQIDELLTKDEGIDPKLDMPIKLVGPTVGLTFYDDALSEMSSLALERGCAIQTIDHCLHLGVAFDADPATARKRAWSGAVTALNAPPVHPRITELREQLDVLVRPDKWWKGGGVIETNCRGLSDRPFSTWFIPVEQKVAFVERRLSAFSIFDLSGFMYLAETLGVTAELTTRKEAESIASDMPRHMFPRWGNRLLRLQRRDYDPIIMGGGMVMRIVSELVPPNFVLEFNTRTRV